MTTIRLTPCESRDDAFQYADASGETPIVVCNVPGILYATAKDSELDRVGRALDFAYLTEDGQGRIMTVPAN